MAKNQDQENMRWYKRYRPNGNELVTVDQAIRVSCTIGHKEMDHNVYQESNLTSNVQQEKVLWESSEETKLQWCKEGRVDCPYQYKVHPYCVPPAFTITQNFDFRNPLCTHQQPVMESLVVAATLNHEWIKWGSMD